MLLSFRAANVLSIHEEQSLSFRATDLNDGSARPTKIRDRGKPVSVIPVIGIYGPNGSGKTNILKALRMMREAIVRSVQWFSEPDPERRVPFALDLEAQGEPSFFEADIKVGDERYTYGFELDDDRVRGEWLYAYPKGRRQVWFERDDDGEIAFPGEGLRGEKLDLARRTRHDSLFLTVAAQFNHGQLMPVFEWFRDNFWLISPESRDRLDREAYTRRRVINEPAFRKRVLALLSVADLGITDIEVVPGVEDKIRFIHRAGDGQAPLDYASESLGTQSWFAMLGPLLEVLDRGVTVLVDELDASLHPTICAEIVRMFEDRDANPNNAQLIFTTHDVTLLLNPADDDRVLDRDMIWLTDKTNEGATELYPLSSFDPPPRKDDNIFRKYLIGKYGALPRIFSGYLAREAADHDDEKALA